MSKMLIIPDVHGRDFWRSACEDINAYDHVVFLGDYLDPYQQEGIDIDDAEQGLRDIIELKKNNLEKVTLLLGNHDLHYFTCLDCRQPFTLNTTAPSILTTLAPSNS